MPSRTTDTVEPLTTDESQVRFLYYSWLKRWNERKADKMADLCAEDVSIVGFDGSQMNGRSEVAATLGRIFADHQTGAYVGIIRDVRLLAPNVAILQAVVGMVPPGKSDINPAVNAIQTLIATKQDVNWRIAVFNNTPAAFHGRPDLGEQLTEELRLALSAASPDTLR